MGEIEGPYSTKMLLINNELQAVLIEIDNLSNDWSIGTKTNVGSNHHWGYKTNVGSNHHWGTRQVLGRTTIGVPFEGMNFAGDKKRIGG